MTFRELTMPAQRFFPALLLTGIAALVWGSPPADAVEQQGGHAPATSADGQHAFDFHFGTWRTHILSRRRSASGASQWAKMTGTVIDQPLWNGRANLEKIEASGSGRHFQGLTLFLYEPASGNWSQQYADSSDGIMSEPAYGKFENGRGVLYSWSGSAGSRVLDRDTWSNITPSSYHFEIASSADGGKTWQTKWMERPS